MNLFDRMVRTGLPLAPKFIVGQVAKRYVAGNTLSSAVETMRELNREGMLTTVDILGEEVTARDKAEESVKAYLELVDTIDREDLDRNISIKPTALGLKLDPEFCRSNIHKVATRAKEINGFVRIDMEDHTCTDETIRIYRSIQEDLGNVGVVLQTYLRRTIRDIGELLPMSPNIRICKGIYREPRKVAWKGFETIQENFIYSVDKLLEGGAYVGIATHDPHLVWAGMKTVDRLGLDKDQYEFQMLLGVDPELRRIIVDEGHRLRVYVPYGRDWYPYSIRRLRENPTIARHVMRAMLGMRRG